MGAQGQQWQWVAVTNPALCPPNRIKSAAIPLRRGYRKCGRGDGESAYGWTVPTSLQYSACSLQLQYSEMQGEMVFSNPATACCSGVSGKGRHWWLRGRGLLVPMAGKGPSPAPVPNEGGGGAGGGTGGIVENDSFSAETFGHHTESSMPVLNRSTTVAGGGNVLEWSKGGGKEMSGFGSDAMHVDLLKEGVAAVRIGDLSMPDVELEKIAESINAIERRNETIVQEMNDFTRVLADTAKALSARAQVARIEAAKLKKFARLQQAEEVRRSQELRKAMDLRRIEEKRLEEIRGEQQQRQRAIEDAIKAANAMISSGVAVEIFESTTSSSSEENEDSMASADPFPDIGPTSLNSFSEESHDGDALGPGTVTLPESLECTITHPGALSCTKTTIRKDAARKMASVTMSVTTRCEGDACHSNALDVDDYVGLGVQTLVEMAHELKQSRFQRATDADPVVYEKHRAIVNILKNGRVLSAKPNEPPSKFGHESFVAELVDSRTGHKIEAMFKPRVEGDADGWHRAPVECVAYELNLMLGMDYVPPVAYRKGGVMVGDRQFEEGAFIYYVPSTKPLKRVAAAGWGVSVARLLSDTRILDVLLNNSDRHHGHFLYGDHWADGKPRPVLIDHAAGFRKEAVVAMEHENAFQTGAVRCVAAKTYLRLRFLEKEMVASKFREDLSSAEICSLMERRDQVLTYLDQLVKERGYHRTVIEI